MAVKVKMLDTRYGCEGNGPTKLYSKGEVVEIKDESLAKVFLENGWAVKAKKGDVSEPNTENTPELEDDEEETGSDEDTGGEGDEDTDGDDDSTDDDDSDDEGGEADEDPTGTVVEKPVSEMTKPELTTEAKALGLDLSDNPGKADLAVMVVEKLNTL